jgi:hypothetical protein
MSGQPGLRIAVDQGVPCLELTGEGRVEEAVEPALAVD